MNGSTLLKVVGILMIIFSGIALVGLLAGGALLAMFGGAFLILLLMLLGFGLVILQFVAGIIGVVNSKKPDKANVCVVLGVVVLVLRVIDGVSAMAMPYVNFNVVTFLIGLVLPVLYLVGAVQLKNMTAMTPPQNYMQQ